MSARRRLSPGGMQTGRLVEGVRPEPWTRNPLRAGDPCGRGGAGIFCAAARSPGLPGEQYHRCRHRVRDIIDDFNPHRKRWDGHLLRPMGGWVRSCLGHAGSAHHPDLGGWQRRPRNPARHGPQSAGSASRYDHQPDQCRRDATARPDPLFLRWPRPHGCDAADCSHEGALAIHHRHRHRGGGNSPVHR